MPLLGSARRALGSARAAGAIGALLESGVPIARAMSHGAPASGDAALTAKLLRARDAIVAGRAPSHALGAESALTPTALRLVRAGEDTGRLGPMLSEAGRLEQHNAERLIRNAVHLVEPAFILGFGGLVALVAAALLQALYGVRPA
jgi:general secretion pathway protein F